ncbi:D-aminoacid aminotransferase-like PLP-dependent enzymes superfamily protein isoform X2 [Tasmannia lanceolata]|uniref:D-aminoacid aminotransferase-like PLP-dependent enzymes superfamily protein isoform X2 n=1 Tax=Tasmannia lanceolata TaxID=3420 RepID=UPI0040632B91
MTSSNSFLVINGVLSHSPPETPSVSVFLNNQSGAYTTTRTHNNTSSLLFWDRHLHRLSNSALILSKSNPYLFTSDMNWVSSFSSFSNWVSLIRPLVEESLCNGLCMALREKGFCGTEGELAITTLVSGNSRVCRGIDVYVHVGGYDPMVFGRRENGARLAVVGCGRDVAMAKYSEWVRRRKYMEKLRPPSATELLLSNDGDQILEGSVTNFFVVCRREMDAANDDPNEPKSKYSFEVQTAAISDGVLPGVIRQLVIEVCSSKGIPLREVAPSWSDRNLWEEAFVTTATILCPTFGLGVILEIGTNSYLIEPPQKQQMFWVG